MKSKFKYLVLALGLMSPICVSGQSQLEIHDLFKSTDRPSTSVQSYAVHTTDVVPDTLETFFEDSARWIEMRVTYSNKGAGHLDLNGNEISEKEYADLCGQIDERLWKQYRNGSRYRKAGTALLCTFAATAVIGAGMMAGSLISHNNNSGILTVAGACMMGSSGAFLIAGITVYCYGKNMRQCSVDSFNQHVESKYKPFTLNVGTTESGMGLVLNF